MRFFDVTTCDLTTCDLTTYDITTYDITTYDLKTLDAGRLTFDKCFLNSYLTRVTKPVASYVVLFNLTPLTT